MLLYDHAGKRMVDLPGISMPWETRPSISGDGRYIAFESQRPGQPNSTDIYLYDRNTHSLVPLPGLGAGLNHSPSISGDGRYIAFDEGFNPWVDGQDWDPNLYTGGPSAQLHDTGHIYLYDRKTKSLVPLPGLNSIGNAECAQIR